MLWLGALVSRGGLGLVYAQDIQQQHDGGREGGFLAVCLSPSGADRLTDNDKLGVSLTFSKTSLTRLDRRQAWRLASRQLNDHDDTSPKKQINSKNDNHDRTAAPTPPDD